MYTVLYSLIQLQDCPHIFDVDTLDTLMKSESETIQMKACPLCRKPVVNTYRYKDMVNTMLKDNINPIKEKVYGTVHQTQLKTEQLLIKIQQVMTTQIRAIGNKHWSLAYETIKKTIQLRDKNTSLLQLEMYHTYLEVLETVGKYYTKYKTTVTVSQVDKEIEGQVKMICDVLVRNKQKISQQQQVDIANELKRLNSTVQLATLLDRAKQLPNTANAVKAATDAVLTWRVFNETTAVECLKKLQVAVNASGIVSKEERDMVVRAIGLGAGNWYKCPNGHLYSVGGCGMARQSARCIECKTNIGVGGIGIRAGMPQ